MIIERSALNILCIYTYSNKSTQNNAIYFFSEMVLMLKASISVVTIDMASTVMIKHLLGCLKMAPLQLAMTEGMLPHFLIDMATIVMDMTDMDMITKGILIE